MFNISSVLLEQKTIRMQNTRIITNLTTNGTASIIRAQKYHLCFISILFTLTFVKIISLTLISNGKTVYSK